MFEVCKDDLGDAEIDFGGGGEELQRPKAGGEGGANGHWSFLAVVGGPLPTHPARGVPSARGERVKHCSSFVEQSVL